jgi:hypothetical protein
VAQGDILSTLLFNFCGAEPIAEAEDSTPLMPKATI